MAETILDMGGMRKKRATIVDQTTGQALYSISNDSGLCRATITDIYRCSPDGTREQRPYATFKGKSVYLRDALTGVETKVKKNDFLFKKGFLRSRNRFLLDGKEYHIKANLFRFTTKLYPSDNTNGTPLAYLKIKKSSFTPFNRRMIVPSSSTLLHDGRPTRLLDMLIIADMISRDNMDKNMKAAKAFRGDVSHLAG